MYFLYCWSLALIVAITLLWRNYKAYIFIRRISVILHDYRAPFIKKGSLDFLQACKKSDEFYNKYNYHQLLFSFKRLKLSKWYTDEEIKSITNDRNIVLIQKIY